MYDCQHWRGTRERIQIEGRREHTTLRQGMWMRTNPQVVRQVLRRLLFGSVSKRSHREGKGPMGAWAVLLLAGHLEALTPRTNLDTYHRQSKITVSKPQRQERVITRCVGLGGWGR